MNEDDDDMYYKYHCLMTINPCKILRAWREGASDRQDGAMIRLDPPLYGPRKKGLDIGGNPGHVS